MPDQTVRTSPGWGFALLWMIAPVPGAAAGIAVALLVNLVLVALFGATAPLPGTPLQQALTLTVDGMGATMLMLGLGMGLGQWLLLRRYVRRAGWWIVASGAAMLLAGLFRMSLPADTPVEMIGPLTVPAGAVLLAVCQWLALRGRVAHAGRWIAICLAGWAPTLAMSILGEYLQLSEESLLTVVIIIAFTILPFAVAAGGMVWLLRQTTATSRAMA